jgi:hypothetical protein
MKVISSKQRKIQPNLPFRRHLPRQMPKLKGWRVKDEEEEVPHIQKT